MAAAGRPTISTLDGSSLSATARAVDPLRELALLVVEADGLPSVELGRSSVLAPGTPVVALGRPLGIARAATLGADIAVGQALPGIPSPHVSSIASDLHLRPGHSGGALLDARGRWVGVNAMMAGPDVGLAGPVDEAQRFVAHSLRPSLLETAASRWMLRT